MALQIGDAAPDFEAQTTEGRMRFHEWMGDGWAVLFSHPKDYTPVCTTELGYMAKIKPEFDRRNVKIVGLSADRVDDHAKWSSDIEQTQGHTPASAPVPQPTSSARPPRPTPATRTSAVALDEPTRKALRAEFGRRLGSPKGPFHLSARAWYARGNTPM